MMQIHDLQGKGLNPYTARQRPRFGEKMLSRQQELPRAHILLGAAPPQLEPPAGPVSYFHVEIHPRCPGAGTLPVHCSSSTN